MNAGVSLITARDVAEQVLGGTLPYEEAWRVLAEAVVGLTDIAQAAKEVCDRLDSARVWNLERGRRSVVHEIDFAIGATLSLRRPLEALDE